MVGIYILLGVFMNLSFVLAYFVYYEYDKKKDVQEALAKSIKSISSYENDLRFIKRSNIEQRDQINYQRKQLSDNIVCAKRVQDALLSSATKLNHNITLFIFYKPLELVSGDFYWFYNFDTFQIIILADSTGHGVQGALTSALGVVLLNKIILRDKIYSPEKILDNLRTDLISTLNQTVGGGVQDGMDASVCLVDFTTNTLLYSGANSHLYLINETELIQYKSDRMGVSISDRMDPFSLTKIDIVKNNMFYIFSDGYAGQIGGSKGKRFMSSQLRDTFMSIKRYSLPKQQAILDLTFENWKGEHNQLDDVTVIGVKYL